MSEIKKNIQKNIAIYRKNNNLTQKELAARIGVPVTSLASWEQGKSLPDIDTLFSLCYALGTDIASISGFALPERSTDGSESNGFRNFMQNLNSMNEHSAKVGHSLTPQYSADEVQLIEDYRAFNDEGKEKIRDYVADLKCNSRYKKRAKPIMDKEA